MEQIPSQRTKTADEKFCSECGEIIKVKAEICPCCGVRQLPVPRVKQLPNRVLGQNKIKFFSGNLIQKLLYTAGPMFLLFAVFLLAINITGQWHTKITGSLLPALFCGVIAMALPTERKIIYIPCSIAIFFIIFILAIILFGEHL